LGYYKDLRELISALDERGLLIRVKRPINKDTELMPLVRWQFRGLPEDQRKAFLFENVVDCKGRAYSIPVLVGAFGASRAVYATGLQCAKEEIYEKLVEGPRHLIPPVMVDRSKAPVKGEIHVGNGLEEHGGLGEFPIPISTPGYDPAPYFTSPCWVTKDPDSGIPNVGTYRTQVKSPTRTGIMNHPAQHVGIHWAKYKERGLPMPAALVVGTVPAFGVGSVTKYPYNINEFSVAGGLAGEPIEIVKCETVDLEVPATAEMVFEGEIPTDEVEWEAPFGETTGYMGHMTLNGFFNIKCITHRKNPVYQAYISQFPPSESTLLRGISAEAALYKALKYDCNIPTVTDVALHESCASWYFLVIKLKKTNPAQVWQALHVASGFDAAMGKIIIAVDDDIDARDADAVNWAMAFRMQAHRDVQIVAGKMNMLDPSAVPPNTPYEQAIYPAPAGTSALLIDATMKWAYPPVSLPRQEFMENALEIWQELGLPELKPKRPWHGYELGGWTDENREDAERALRGEHYKTGEERAARRSKTRDSRSF